MLDAAGEAARYAAERGAVIAVETGPEPLKTLRGFVDACGKGMGINFDPANLVMVGADDEVSAVADAGSAIVHTHAKDGRSLSPILPEEFYHKFAEDGLDWILSNPCYEETPLGQGSVRWIPYLRALQSVGYNGFLTIEREAKNGRGGHPHGRALPPRDHRRPVKADHPSTYFIKGGYSHDETRSPFRDSAGRQL